MVLTSDHRLFIGVVISEQSINLSKETFTVCVFVRHLFSFYPFYFDFHIHGDPKTKAKLLNSQFSSVFSTDNTSNISNLGTSQYNEAPQITVNQNGEYKLLHGLNQHKATGPDEISTKFLKEMAAPVTPVLTFIFQVSLNQGQTHARS
jgi:hypothetical protein